MSNLTQRVLTAIALAAIVLACLFYLPDPAAQIFFTLVLLIGAWEWSAFLFARRPVRQILYVLALVITAAYLYISLASTGPLEFLLWAALAWWIVAALWLILLAGRAVFIWSAIAGFAVLLPAIVAVLSILSLPGGEWLFVWLAIIVAAADVGAYFTGKSIGRNKLAPQISPGKTWEGLVGGLVAAVIAGIFGALLLDRPVAWFGVVAAVIAAFSVVGDLTVSAFKRHAGLKDSGWILPGHGGVLDRVDGLVAALPLFLLALQLVVAE